MIDYQFKQNFQVRDYECDLQGIVNNAVYLHYLEHTRHEFLKQSGIDFGLCNHYSVNSNKALSERAGSLWICGHRCALAHISTNPTTVTTVPLSLQNLQKTNILDQFANLR